MGWNTNPKYAKLAANALYEISCLDKGISHKDLLIFLNKDQTVFMDKDESPQGVINWLITHDHIMILGDKYVSLRKISREDIRDTRINKILDE